MHCGVDGCDRAYTTRRSITRHMKSDHAEYWLEGKANTLDTTMLIGNPSYQVIVLAVYFDKKRRYQFSRTFGYG